MFRLMNFVRLATLAVALLAGAASARDGLRQITEDKSIACKSRADRERLVQFASQKDNDAYMAFLTKAVLAQQCRFFALGQRVFLEDKSAPDSFARLVKVRAKGEIESYWIGDIDLD